MFKKINKKYLLPILMMMILAILYIDNKYIFNAILNKKRFASEMIQMANYNKETIFQISKIIKYSSAEAVDNTLEQNLQDVSIHQYSDIAIYIDNMSDQLSEKNSVKELYIDNFHIDVDYEYGETALYYKNPFLISKFRLVDENKISDVLNYDIIYTNEQNEDSDYEKPTFFADCSNPIIIGYVNKNIIEHYQVSKDNGLVSFDGRIFENLNIDLDKLSPKISFTVHIKNNLDEEFICNASANLRLQTEEGSANSGYIIEIMDGIGYYKFFKL